ncbi:phospholipase A2-like [Peromyscus californicus insignis]|uniref:phospholipase A2-like n=1 Tax=Peromyscus californicus insignis TaxID=564181 RepID=UPI0022A79817|nr:phospholipase A2-like [Peromyscus californicus insignis]
MSLPSTTLPPPAEGTTAQGISSRAVWQFSNALQCTLPLINPFPEYNYYGCYCGFLRFFNPVEDLDRCCQIHDNCLAQVNNLENCAVLIRNPYTSSYSYSCSGSEITCSEENNPCEAFICNCAHQAAICFFNTPYNKQNKRDNC